MPESSIINGLETFNPITLGEMDNVQLMNRVDTKFTISENELKEIMPELKEHFRVLDIKGKRISKYKSLYFDDEDYSFYIDHHRQKVDRYKVRYRTYVDSGLSFLEVKHKNKGRTDKKRIVVDKIENKLSPEHQEFIANSGVKTNYLKPALLNSFQRITLVGKVFNERLTLDLDLSFEINGKSENIENLVIAELKQEKVTRNSPFYKIMKKRLIRPFRISKYCTGLIKLLGSKNIKYNRFKKKLIQIDKINKNVA
jgi:hypothetical protein